MLLELQQLSKRLGGNEVIRGVSFGMEQGEIVGLIGPNGAGKTTLFNLITRFLRLDSGRIMFEDREISRLRPDAISRMGLCRTFQVVKPFGNLSTLDNVMVGALIAAGRVDEARKNAYQCLEWVGLQDRWDMPARNLPVGQRKLLELARALATRPKLLCLDEITGGLTPLESTSVMEAIKRIHDLGVTLLIIEHNMKAVMRISTRIIVLDSGKKIAEGRPQEVAKDPVVIRSYLGEEYILLKVENLSAYYGDVQVLFNVSLEVEQGEIVAVVGANAAGKTTLLRSICQQTPRTEGQIRFQGELLNVLATNDVVERGVIMVPEGRGVFPFMSVQDNLDLGAYNRRARPQRSKTLENVFALFPILKERRNQLAGSLSGGEQQMLALGRGLMGLPQLLLLDEPSLGLAPIIVKGIFEFIRTISELNITLVLVEQHINHALAVAHRAYVLENGCVVLEGKADDVRKNELLLQAYVGE